MTHLSRPVATRVCVIRHGETDWNAERRIQGHTDVPLNATGRRQALAMAYSAAHQRFDALYSSDLARAVETARALAEREDQAVTTLSELRERHFGCFQGLTVSEAALRHPGAHAAYLARDPRIDFGDGESLEAFAGRANAVLDRLARRHITQTIAVVTHSGVLDVLYRRATGRALSAPRDFEIPNCAQNWFGFDGHAWHVEAWADRHYLGTVLTGAPE